MDSIYFSDMRNYLAKSVQRMRPSDISHFFNLVQQTNDVIPLLVGEPDFFTPLHIRDRAIERMLQEPIPYTHDSGLLELRQAISRYLLKRFSLSYDPHEEILVTVGSGEAIDLTFRVLLDPGDEVIIPQPNFVSYAPLVVAQQGIPVGVQTKAEDGFILTPSQLSSAITPRTKAVILCYPNNPTGSIMTRSDYEALIPLITQHNLIVITDEIYAELTYGLDHTSFASLPQMKERTIVISGFAKAYAMTGWRIGYVCAHTDFIQAMVRIHQYGAMCAPTISQWGALEALENGESEMNRMREAYNERRLFLLQGLRSLGYDCHEPKGAFYVFPSIQHTGMNSEQFAIQVLQEAKVGVIPGYAFGLGGEGYVRLSYATSMDQLEEALYRLKKWKK